MWPLQTFRANLSQSSDLERNFITSSQHHMAPETFSYPIFKIVAFDPKGKVTLQFNQVEGVSKE
jgi:hypothetical protein